MKGNYIVTLEILNNSCDRYFGVSLVTTKRYWSRLPHGEGDEGPTEDSNLEPHMPVGLHPQIPTQPCNTK